MRLIFLFVFAGLMQVSASLYSQTTKLNLSLQNTRLEDVLEAIEEQSEYRFAYSAEYIDLNRYIDVDIRDKTINEVLNAIFKGTDVKYMVDNRHIMLYSGENASQLNAVQQQLEIFGKVTDSSGTSLPGVTVVVKSTTRGIITDADGNYTFPKVSADATLVFSFVGMKTQEIKVAGKTEINVMMEEETVGIEEVVAIGYGTVKKQNLTGSVAKMKTEALEERAITSLGEAFAGQLAGLQAQQTSGKPGAELTITIRGNSTINASNAPLYVIDGIPSGDNMKDLNPNDIASIEVLKDASSAAIYGARGANGVVLITTKQGKKGKPTFDFVVNYGLQKVDNIVDMMDTYEYTAYCMWARNEGYLRTGGSMDDPVSSRPSTYQYPDSFLDPETLPNVNWQKVIYHVAPMQTYQLSTSGGGDRGTYLISGSYMDQEGIVKETKYRRFNLRMNTTLNVGQHLKLGMNIAPSFSEENNPDSEGKESALHHAINMTPIVPVDSNTEEWGYTEGAFTWPNPLERLKEVHDETRNNKVLTNVWGELMITRSLTFRSQYGYNYREERNSYFKPSNVNTGASTYGTSYVKDWHDWSFQNTISYNKKVVTGFDINVLLGQSIEGSKYYYNYAKATGYPNDLVYTLNVASTPSSVTTTEAETALASFFGRLNFNIKEKYLLTMNLRRDGSSKFGADNKWGWFPSMALGWKINREEFMKSAEWIDLLKLRASVGKTGNNSIGDYESIALLEVTDYNLNGSIVSGVSPYISGNPDLGWETKVSKTVGFDLSVFKNRFQANLDLYIDDTKDMLLDVPVSYMTGYSSILQNIGKVQNKGWEFEITSYNIKGTFNWQSSFNLSRNTNEVKSLGPEGTPITTTTNGYSSHITKIGEAIGSYYMYKTDGLLLDDDFDENGDAIVPVASGQEKGNLKIVDVSEDGAIDSDDRTILGSNQPDFIWGFTNRFSYTGFDLNILIQGAHGGKIFFNGARHMDSGLPDRGQFSRWVHCWKPEYESGQSAIPETTVDMSWDGKTPYYYGNNVQYNDTWLYNASFVRIKNLSLGYNLPQSLCNRLGIAKARVYIMGDNLYTWDHYPFSTPETSTYKNNTTSPGMDYGTYPISRKYSLGINLTF